MKAFLMLVWKEWRDARTTVVVAFVLAAAISFGFHQFLPASLHGAWSATLGLEILPSLFATVLASDLVAGDARGGRLLALRALPVAPLVAWAARVAWLAGATVLFGAWCGAMQLAALEAVGSDEAIGSFLNAASGSLHWLHLGLCVATGALFASSLGVGGVKAMLVGALVVLPLSALAAQFVLRERLPVAPAHISLCALVLGLAFLAASAVVFCHGRLHLGARWRPALLGWSVLLLAVLPSGALASRTLANWMELGPGTPHVQPEYVLSSPDGRYVAVQVYDRPRLFQRSPASEEFAETVWIVDVGSADLEVLPGRQWEARRWSEAGDLLVFARRPQQGEDLDDYRWVEPETGAILGTPRDSSEVYESSQTYPSWARSERSGADPNALRTIVWKERGLRETIDPAGGTVIVQRLPGCVLHHTSAGGIDRIDMGLGRRTLVESGARPGMGWDAVTLDDRFLIVQYVRDSQGSSSAAVLDAHDGATIAGPWVNSYVTWLHAGRSGRFVVVATASTDGSPFEGFEARLLDLDTGEETALGVLYGPDGNHQPSVQRLPDGRLVVLRPDGAVELLAPDGSHLRVLVAP